MTEIADILEEAADYIDVHGWRQGTRSTIHDHRVCLVEAVSAACQEAERWPQADLKSEVYERLLGHVFPTERHKSFNPFRRVRGERLIGWNDDPGRTRVEVTDALRHTAKEIRNGEA